MVNMKNQKGASAVEFAIVLPLLVIVSFGIVEFSLALYDKAMITNSSREGARLGIVFRDPPLSKGELESLISARVTDFCNDRLVTFGAATNVTAAICDNQASSYVYSAGDPIPVCVSYHYDYLVLPGFISALTGGIDMGAQTIMRAE